jgi:hypothetical protein
MRNNVVHVDGFVLPSAAEYEVACKKCLEEVQAVKVPVVAPKESPAARVARLQAGDRAYVKAWFRAVGGALAISLPSLAAFFLMRHDTGWVGWFLLVPLLAGMLALSFAVYCGFPVPVPLFAPSPVLRYLRTRDAGPLAAEIRWVYAFRQGAPINYSSGSASYQHREARRASTDGSDASSVPYPADPPLRAEDSADNAAAAALEHPSVNPASGLAMVEGTSVDIGGNPFGGVSDDSIGGSFADDLGGGFSSLDPF